MDNVFESIFSSVDALVYRCKNDKSYTMQFLEGGVTQLLGYRPDEILGNRVVSYVGLTHKDDEERVFATVDAAIDAGRSWDVAYRMTHKKGHVVWVRERGIAVYDDAGELAFLQGLVVGAEAEVALRNELEDTLTNTRDANAEIIKMAENLARSVRELSMLSVNARIEAARSGQAGLGFAVVANEIKTLADRNAAWAARIRECLGQTGKSSPDHRQDDAVSLPADS